MLSHYFSILKDRRPANFEYAAAVSLPRKVSRLKEEELWSLHDELMDKYYKSKSNKKIKKTDKPNLIDLKIEIARRIFTSCYFCERRCGKDRRKNEKGFCEVGKQSFYSSEFLHMGEEPELVPSHTIFFSGCTFRCCYCQNWDIAMSPDSGRGVDCKYLAQVIALGRIKGSKNVNFVGGNPDPHLLTILKIIKELKISIPVVWNSNMYASLETMKLLEGLVDLFLGDFRYGDDICASKYSEVDNYFKVVSRNFDYAYNTCDVILRHLVLPGHIRCCTEPIMAWVKDNIPDVYFNLMFQYHPCYRAPYHSEIDRRLTREERSEAIELAEKYRLNYK